MATSTTPSRAEKPRTLSEPVDPTHQRAVGDERANPLGLVSRELHEADPPHHNHQAVASQLAADRLDLGTHRPRLVCSILHQSRHRSLLGSRWSRVRQVLRRGCHCDSWLESETRTLCHLPERCSSVVVTCSMQRALIGSRVERTSRSCISRASISTKYRGSVRHFVVSACESDDWEHCRPTNAHNGFRRRTPSGSVASLGCIDPKVYFGEMNGFWTQSSFSEGVTASSLDHHRGIHHEPFSNPCPPPGTGDG